MLQAIVKGVSFLMELLLANCYNQISRAASGERLLRNTVMSHAGHQVYHKWAALAPAPEDQQMSDEVRGYLQCDISITGKDSSRPAPEVSKGDENDFEK